jgi:predicted MFS family arabinose efflux permease
LSDQVAITAPARAATTATRGFFLLCGIAAASWASMVPFAQTRLALDEARLGVVLLCLGIGSTAAMPLAGWLSHRYGNRHLTGISALLLCGALPALALAPSSFVLAAALLWFGATIGVLDVAMNSHAVEVEKLHGRPVMSGFHGMYSAGGLAGAVGMTALLGVGLPLVGCAIAVALLLALIAVTQWPKLLSRTPDAPDEPKQRRSGFALPSRLTLLIGALCFVVFLAEGAVLDWSAVFLSSERSFAISRAGLGYAAFSIAMTAGRLLGDRITAALGPVRIVRLGGALAAAGFALATLLPWSSTALIGFALVGIGASNIVPVLFSAAGRLPGTSPGVSIAIVTAVGYAGVLSGPALIGFVANASSLPVALGALGVMLLAVAASASITRRE